jgi:hypothetical protein
MKIPAALFAALALCTGTAHAGTTGVLRGTVTDKVSAKPIAGARVHAQSPAQADETTTDASGHYVFIALSPGTYTVTVAAPGYQVESFAGIPVSADTATVINVQTHRRASIIACVDCFVMWLFRTGWGPSVADQYNISAARARVTQTVPYSAASALRFVPGITPGTGQVVPHR